MRISNLDLTPVQHLVSLASGGIAQIWLPDPNLTRQQKSRSHPSERPFSCSQCSKTFMMQKTLNYHLRHLCGKGPRFQCPYCPFQAKWKNSILKHARCRHKDPYPDVLRFAWGTKADKYISWWGENGLLKLLRTVWTYNIEIMTIEENNKRIIISLGDWFEIIIYNDERLKLIFVNNRTYSLPLYKSFSVTSQISIQYIFFFIRKWSYILKLKVFLVCFTLIFVFIYIYKYRVDLTIE